MALKRIKSCMAMTVLAVYAVLVVIVVNLLVRPYIPDDVADTDWPSPLMDLARPDSDEPPFAPVYHLAASPGVSADSLTGTHQNPAP